MVMELHPWQTFVCLWWTREEQINESVIEINKMKTLCKRLIGTVVNDRLCGK